MFIVTFALHNAEFSREHGCIMGTWESHWDSRQFSPTS